MKRQDFGKELRRYTEYSSIPKTAVITRAVYLNNPSIILKALGDSVSQLKGWGCGKSDTIIGGETTVCKNLSCTQCPFGSNKKLPVGKEDIETNLKIAKQWLGI